jgi:hypothetical protein
MSDDNKGTERVTFSRGYDVCITAIDGTWRRDCQLNAISKMEIHFLKGEHWRNDVLSGTRCIGAAFPVKRRSPHLICFLGGALLLVR